MIKDLEIPDSVTEIKNNAFVNCKKLKQLAIPNSVNKIGDAAFMESGIRYLDYAGTSSEWSEIEKIGLWDSDLYGVRCTDTTIYLQFPT